ncbi:MAG: hypothetical protein AAB089_08775 [Nitrospirota bacterium]
MTFKIKISHSLASFQSITASTAATRNPGTLIQIDTTPPFTVTSELSLFAAAL